MMFSNKQPATRIAANKLQEGEMDRGTKHLPPTSRLTGHQTFYIFGMAGVGGGCISAGVNFAIAYAMYTLQDTAKQPIRLFRLPNTLAGDAALTIIIQCILTWFVEWLLVAHDLRACSVRPIGFVQQPSSSLLRWFLFLEREPSTKLHNVLQHALRGFLICVPAFLVLWPVSVGILIAVGEQHGGDWVFEDRWTPQVFKAVLGGMLGLMTTPLMAMFWLVSAGWDSDEESITQVKEEC